MLTSHRGSTFRRTTIEREPYHRKGILHRKESHGDITQNIKRRHLLPQTADDAENELASDSHFVHVSDVASPGAADGGSFAGKDPGAN